MLQRLVTLGVVAVLTAGCSTQSTWTPTVDTYDNSRAQYLSRDLGECRELATRSSGSAEGETAKGVAGGALIGAAAGALIGVAVGSPGAGAAIGATAGGAGGGVYKAATTDDQFKASYRRCMRQRGHNVVD